MPRINNNEQRNTAALEDNFMNPASPAYRTVSSFRKSLERPADAERAMNSVSTGNNGVFSQLLFDKKNEGKLRDADIRPQVQEEKRSFQLNQQDRSPDHAVIPGQG